MKLRIGKVVVIAALCCVALFALGQTKPATSDTAKSNGTRAAVGQLRVAAAADLAPALESIVAEFKKSQGADVKVTYGASGTLTTQIEQGAPFDVFMSADEGYPKRLVDKKLADGKTLTTYTRGRLVLYILPSITADVTHVGVKALTSPALQKIAIANPETAPYGRAAVAAMKKAGVYDEVKPKLVIAENVGQAAQFARSGNVQAAIIALSAMNDRELRRHGRVVEVDLNDYPPLDQAAVVTKQGAKNPLAAVFVQYLKGQMAQGLLVRYGFMPPSTYKDEGGPMAPKKTEGKSDRSSPKKETTPKK